MHFLKSLLITSLISLSYALNAQVKTIVEVNLEVIDDDYITVKVFPPVENQSEWVYVIPEIIPGTYMKINNERYYKKLTAYDANGEKLKVKRKDNYFHIKGKGRGLSFISYQVQQTQGSKRIWDKMIACGGSVFTDEGFLLNAQMVSGYYEGYQDSPFEIRFRKIRPLYGSTSMDNLKRSSNIDVFTAENYYSWIDQPILYGQADTTSFMIDDQKFIVAVRAESGKSS